MLVRLLCDTIRPRFREDLVHRVPPCCHVLLTRGRLVAVQVPIYAQARELRAARREDDKEHERKRKRIRAVVQGAKHLICSARATAREASKAARLKRDAAQAVSPRKQSRVASPAPTARAAVSPHKARG